MSNEFQVSDQNMQSLYILAGALIAGAVLCAAVALVYVLVILGNPGPTGQLVSLFMLFFSVVSSFPIFIMAQFMRPSGADASDADETTQLLGRYRGRLILRFAGIQGACFTNIAAYLIEHNLWSIGVAGGCVFLMLTMFPTRTRVEHWIETQQMQQRTV